MSFPNLIIHIGLHKTGSTFLQQNIFPNLDGIEYIRWRNLEYFLRLDDSKRFLISSESLSGFTFAGQNDREKAIRVLGGFFRDARIIVVFRSHGGFLASLYSQYLRYGGTSPFDEFFEMERLENSSKKPVVDAGSVNYRAVIEAIERHFKSPPFVVLMEDMFNNPKAFMDDLCQYCRCLPGDARGGFSKKPVNRGLKQFQGEILRKINRTFGVKLSYDGRNRPFAHLRRFRMDPTTLLVSRFSFVPSTPLVSGDVKSAIDESFASDWAFVKAYAAARKWSHSE